MKTISKIKVLGNFPYVNVSPILYGNGDVYITIDLVDADDIYRLKAIRNLKKSNSTVVVPHDLIDKWHLYEEKGANSLLKNHGREPQHCRSQHCMFINDKTMECLEEEFIRFVPRYKTAIIKALQQDADPRRREAAAYLLAYLKQPHSVAECLIPAMTDPSPYVRNAATRVLGSLFRHYNPRALPWDTLNAMLDFPDLTDRNKALRVVLSLTKYPENIAVIKSMMSRQLVRLLRARQPNIHDLAYSILRIISKNKFADRDYASWKTWVGQ